MQRFTSTVTSSAASTNSVAHTQTPGAAGNLTLTSSSVTFGTNSAQYVTVSSGGNIATLIFTFTGTDVYGNALSTTITGVSGNTVTSTVAFKTVTNVAVSAAAGSALTAGNSAYAEGVMYVADSDANPFSIGFGTIITSGSPTWTVQHTFDDTIATGSSSPQGISGPGSTAYVFGSSSNTWFNHPVVAGVTANTDGNYAFPVFAIKLTLSAAGAVKIKLLQSGGGSR